MKTIIVILWVLAGLFVIPQSRALTLDQEGVDEFIRYMTREHDFDESVLRAAFGAARGHERILEIMDRPAESKPWYEYRAIFMTAERIAAGVEFWNSHSQALARAANQYGVAAEVIVAIIGVETFYGRNAGSYPVLESVATLAFHYPKRAEFFRQELEQFLLLTREENVDPLALTGSYAGAMGMPQFISSSFRHYAVDFNGDGRRNIWTDVADVVGSVANYLSVHGWRRGAPIATAVEIARDDITALTALGLKPQRTVSELRRQGVVIDGEVDAATRAALIDLESRAGREYWLGFENFYAITRYNHSALYAMAVFQLAEEIRMRRTSQGQ